MSEFEIHRPYTISDYELFDLNIFFYVVCKYQKPGKTLTSNTLERILSQALIFTDIID